MAKIDRLRRKEYFADPLAQVAVHREPGQPEMGPHRHDFIEIAVVLSGAGVHVTEGMRQQVQGGDVLVINSSRSHAYENTRALNLVNILIREDVFKETEKELGMLPGYHALFTLEPVRWRQRNFTSHLRLNGEELKLAAGWIDALEEETQRKSEGGLLLAKAWVLLLIGLLARHYGKDTARSPRLEMRLGRILSRIEQNVEEKFTVAALARESAMSERTFLRRFREATGSSPVDYIIKTRIRQARELLAAGTPGLSITEIAFRCGFRDSNYFSRQFRRLAGVSPRRFGRG